MSSNGKGVIAFLLVSLMLAFGVAVQYQTEAYGFNVGIELSSVSLAGFGVYDITGEFTIENTNDFEVILYRCDIGIYNDDSKDHMIFEYQLDQKYSLAAGETFESGKVTGRITLENDDIPDSVYIVVDNLRYYYDGETFDRSWDCTQEFNLADFL